MTNVLFLEYPKCSTCKKAKKWLDDHGVNYEDRHIVEDNPTAEELKAWHERSELPLRRFFNTSGILYRELGVKNLFAIGDGAGVTRGLMQASASGVHVARVIASRK